MSSNERFLGTVGGVLDLSMMVEAQALDLYLRFAGKVDDSHLHAFFRTAHLYWSMSEHEGFGVPLIEAMWFDIPVLAYKSTAVTETLGQAGILFNDKQDLAKVAALAKLCVHDDQLKVTILQAQQNRRLDFLPKVIFPIIDSLVQQLESQL